METEEQIQRFETIKNIGEEIVTEPELFDLLQREDSPIVYDGFEPSGRLNIANCLMKVHNTNLLIQNGCKVIFWIADYYAQLNQKLGGNLKNIQTVGQYMIQTWIAAGLDTRGVEFRWASQEINRNSVDYWNLVMDISRRFNIARMVRCTKALGREESNTLSLSQLIYPAMQVADIFLLDVDICQMGNDQRKVNTLARKYVNLIRKEKDRPKLAKMYPPIILSHHMIMGLKQDQEKMSKSDPDSCIYMDDAEGDINRKINKAYCPPPDSNEAVTKNPIMDYLKNIVFPIRISRGEIIKIERKDQDSIEYQQYNQLEADYLANQIHPEDLKNGLKKYLNILIEPVRKQFQSNENLKLLNRVKFLQSKYSKTTTSSSISKVKIEIKGFDELILEIEKIINSAVIGEIDFASCPICQKHKKDLEMYFDNVFKPLNQNIVSYSLENNILKWSTAVKNNNFQQQFIKIAFQ